jgi:lactoylglutathione lyase
VLKDVQHLAYVILLCDDLPRMKAYYRDVFAFEVASESDTDMAFRVGDMLLGLRKRTRGYDGRGVRLETPGVQLAFLVSRAEVDRCHAELVAKGVPIFDPPTDQPRGHRTVYFGDPEGNVLEIYAEIERTA